MADFVDDSFFTFWKLIGSVYACVKCVRLGRNYSVCENILKFFRVRVTNCFLQFFFGGSSSPRNLWCDWTFIFPQYFVRFLVFSYVQVYRNWTDFARDFAFFLSFPKKTIGLLFRRSNCRPYWLLYELISQGTIFVFNFNLLSMIGYTWVNSIAE